jgi:hypothetical protein
MLAISSMADQLLVSQEGIRSMDVVLLVSALRFLFYAALSFAPLSFVFAISWVPFLYPMNC